MPTPLDQALIEHQARLRYLMAIESPKQQFDGNLIAIKRHLMPINRDYWPLNCYQIAIESVSNCELVTISN